jgi:hypothetical protein
MSERVSQASVKHRRHAPGGVVDKETVGPDKDHQPAPSPPPPPADKGEDAPRDRG